MSQSGLTDKSALVCLLLAGVLLPPVAGRAEDASSSPNENSSMPRCGPEMDGQVFCKFGTIYECQFVDPHSMERRTGWRWKTDILRSCAEPSSAGAVQENAVPPDYGYGPQQTNGHGAHGGRGSQGGQGYQGNQSQHTSRGYQGGQNDQGGKNDHGDQNYQGGQGYPGFQSNQGRSGASTGATRGTPSGTMYIRPN